MSIEEAGVNNLTSTTAKPATTTSLATLLLDCSPSGIEDVSGVGDGSFKDPESDPTPEQALTRYVEVEQKALPDSGYVRVPREEGQPGRVDFVYTAEGGKRTVQVQVVRGDDDRWRAIGHIQCA